MINLYEVNGLFFWTEEEIKLRNRLVEIFVEGLTKKLKSINKAFEVIQVEAPQLTPQKLINPNYSQDEVWATNGLVLRPETTMGSYAYAKFLRESHSQRLPLVIWQHGKSFRREQDQVTKNMRLKEFYQLEFQILYSPSTANDYQISVIPEISRLVKNWIGDCRIETSDRLPDYSTSTIDIIHIKSNLEICSISKRTDFPDVNVLEVALGTDRLIYCFQEERLNN